MTKELELARLEGRSYDEIQPDVIKLVYYYVNLWYKTFPILKMYNYDSERIVTDVYHSIYLKTRDDGLSNLERDFIKAANTEGFSMKYISNVIKKATINMLMCRARDVVRKPMLASLDQEVYTDGGKVITLGDTIADKGESVEDIVELKIKLESIPNKRYSDYFYVTSFGEKKRLNTKVILNWVISGYSIREMREKVFNKKKPETNISTVNMSQLKAETLSLARSVLRKEV